MSLEDEFRRSWLASSGDSFADRMTRQSLEASASQTSDLALLLFALKNRFQAELDIHLGGGTVRENRTDAADFADLVRGIADAVKEITKDALGRQRMSPGLLISAPIPGSVRVLLSAASPPELDGQLDAARSETQDSNSLRVVATVLARAGDDAQADMGVIEGLLAALPVRARPGLRRVASAVAASNWEVSGELRRPDTEAMPIHLDGEGARQILTVLDSRESETSAVSIEGHVDGQRRSLGTMWFVSTSVPPIEASVIDQALLEEVATFGASDHLATATFTVVTKYPPGARGAAKRSYVLTQIRPASPDSPAVTLNLPTDTAP